jgi:hypothetical protein
LSVLHCIATSVHIPLLGRLGLAIVGSSCLLATLGLRNLHNLFLVLLRLRILLRYSFLGTTTLGLGSFDLIIGLFLNDLRTRLLGGRGRGWGWDIPSLLFLLLINDLLLRRLASTSLLRSRRLICALFGLRLLLGGPATRLLGSWRLILVVFVGLGLASALLLRLLLIFLIITVFLGLLLT